MKLKSRYRPRVVPGCENCSGAVKTDRVYISDVNLESGWFRGVLGYAQVYAV